MREELEGDEWFAPGAEVSRVATDLGAALEDALGDFVGASLRCVDSGSMREALRSMPYASRHELLSFLSIHENKTDPAAHAGLVVMKLRRAGVPAQRLAAREISEPTWVRIRDLAKESSSSWYLEDEPFVEAVSEVMTDVPTDLVRLALASHSLGDLPAPSAIVALVSDPVALEEWVESREDVILACRSLTPVLKQALSEIRERLEVSVDEMEDDREDICDNGASKPDDEFEGAVSGADDGVRSQQTELSDVEGVNFTVQVDGLLHAHESAEHAAEAIAEAIQGGTPANESDIESLENFGRAFADVARMLSREFGVDVEFESVTDITEAASSLVYNAERLDKEALRERLRVVAEAVVEENAAPVFAQARTQAGNLLQFDSGDWSEEDLDLARSLASIGAAIAGERGPDSTALQEFDHSDRFAGVWALIAIGALSPSDAGPGEDSASITEKGSGPDNNADKDPAPTSESSVTTLEPPAGEVAQELNRTVTSPGEHDARTAEEAASDSPSDDDSSAVGNRAQVVSGGTPVIAPLLGAELSDEAQNLIAELMVSRRFGLAYWAAKTTDAPAVLSDALIAQAYADRLRTPTGECAGALGEHLEEVDIAAMLDSVAGRILALGVGVSGSIFSPFSGSVTLLHELKGRKFFESDTTLVAFIDAVASAASRGLQVEGDFTSRARDLATLDAEVAEVIERASEVAESPRTLVYAPATDVWRNWMRGENEFGSLLRRVREDRVAEAPEVQRLIIEYRKSGSVDRLIDSTHRAESRGRNRGRSRIEARAREKLREQARLVLEIGSEWLELVTRRLASARGEPEWASRQSAFDGLRIAATDLRGELSSIRRRWESSSEKIDAAAGTAVADGLERIVDMLITGEPLLGKEPRAQLVLGGDLLRAPSVQLSDDLTPLGGVTLSEIKYAAEHDDWLDAFAARIQEQDFAAARQILILIAEDDVATAERLDEELVYALDRGRRDCQRLLQDGVLARLDAARRLGHIDDDAWSASYGRVMQLDIDSTLRVGAARVVLTSVLEELDRERDLAVLRAREELKGLRIEDPSLEARIERLLQTGDIATFEELVLAVRDGRPVPAPMAYPKTVEEFFPAVSDGWPEAVVTQADLVDAALQGGRVGPLDFSEVQPESRDVVVGAIGAWTDIAARDTAGLRNRFVDILTALGFSVHAGSLKLDPDLQGDWRRASFAARPVGRALVPSFGSAADGKYRLLASLGAVAEDVLIDRIKNEPGDAPLVVLYFGVMTSSVRRRFAEQVRKRYRRAVALVDTSSFLYVCSKGGSFETFMRVTLPFGGENPYTPHVAGSVPPEMFYGRKYELDDVVRPTGTSFIYGGRRLGKSALLRAAVREVQSDMHHAIYLDLKAHGIGESSPASGLVEVVAKEFRKRGIGPELYPPVQVDQLVDAILDWLRESANRRILLLLDEADEFLNADAVDGFRLVRKMKDLMESSERRFKPVFAGLHQVQRFQSIPNQPLAHLGKPIAIGPLPPQYAFDLVASPLHALGYRFESDEILFRILTNTNYQPNLIQLVCDALLKSQNEKTIGGDAPPYMMSMDDVEAIYNQEELSTQIQSRFEQTINLDQRYRIIAFGLALLSLEGHETSLPVSRIRDECKEWWPIGFENTTDDEFRALLDELVGLGILRSEKGRYAMRSPNVVRMLGTRENLEERLLEAATRQPAPKFEASTFRAAISDDRYVRSPLTEQQMAGLMRAQSGVHVVFGSPATGVGQVFGAMCSADFSDQTVALDTARGAFSDVLERALSDLSDGAHGCLVCQLELLPNEDDARFLQAAEAAVSGIRGKTGSVVFVADPSRAALWRQMLADDDLSSLAAPVFLRRWTAAGLRSWARDPDVDLPFEADSDLENLMVATGGWPSLVDSFVSAYRSSHSVDGSLAVVQTRLSERDAALEFVESTGLLIDRSVSSVWELLFAFAEPLSREDVLELSEDPEAGTAVDLLKGLQVCDVDDEGNLVLEQVVRGAWATMRPGA